MARHTLQGSYKPQICRLVFESAIGPSFLGYQPLARLKGCLYLTNRRAESPST